MFNTSLNNAGHGQLVKSYRNGSSFYRVYSDGYCEQGGIVENTAGSGVLLTQHLLIEYIDTDYIVFLQAISNNAQNATPIVGSTKTTSTFQYYFGTVSNNLMWWACGYVK